jgi:hypothetical protein
VFYELPDGRLKLAYPELDGQEISHSGLLSDVNRRRELAKLIVTCDDFSRATVNRVWSLLMGYGFTQPVDDMGSHNPPSHPRLLARLADELVAHDYDQDGLIRWIVLSEPFGLSDTRTPESWMDAPELGGRPLFARYYADDAPSPDIYRRLVQAVNSRPTGSAEIHGALARRTWLGPTAGPLEIIETSPESAFSGPQWLPQLAQSGMRPERKIQHVFLSVLGRNPTSREMTAAKLVLADRLNDRQALQEVWQTLVSTRSVTAQSFD